MVFFPKYSGIVLVGDAAVLAEADIEYKLQTIYF